MHSVGLPRTCLGFTNILSFMCGLIAFVICVWCAVNTEFFKDVNSSVTSASAVDSIAKFVNLKLWVTPLTSLLIPLAALAMMTSCCGVLGAGCKVKCAIKSYIFLVTTMSVISFWIFFISGIYNIYTKNDSTRKYMQSTIQKYYGKENDFITFMWDYVMIKHECCGAVDYRDFSISNWQTVNPTKVYPIQCCKLANVTSLEPVSTNCSESLDPDMLSHSDVGCFDALHSAIVRNKGKIIFYIILLGLFYMIVILFAYCILRGEPLLGAMAGRFTELLPSKAREDSQKNIPLNPTKSKMVYVEEQPQRMVKVVSAVNPFQSYSFAPSAYSRPEDYRAHTILQYALNSTDNVSQSTTKAPASIKLASVKPLLKLSEPLGVCGAKAHAVVWNTRAVYTWGHNNGQLGHSNEDKFVPAPKRVAISMNNKEEAGIQLVDATDAATVITTSRGDVYLLHKYICKKIAIKQINLRQVCVEAKVNDQGSYSRVTVLLLTNVGQLFIWQDTTNKLTRCVFGLVHQTIITHVALTHDAVYFTTKYGEAFIGTISRKTTPTPAPQPIKKEKERDNKSPLVKFLEKDDCTSVRISKIPNIYRAVSIAVDSEGLNFACLQIKPTCGLRSLPELSPTSMSKHMESLRECATEDDLLHDVIFKVGPKSYPAHMYIIASNSDHLYKLYQEKLAQTNPGDKPEVTLENVHPEAFERVMKYMYTGSCDVAELGPCGLKITKEELVKKDKEAEEELDVIENPSEISAFEVYNKQSDKAKRQRNRRNTDTPPRTHLYCDPVKLVQATAKRLQVMALHKLLDKFFYKNGSICLKESASSNYSRNPAPSWRREAFPELVDTNVVCKDGAAIPAHKCVLAARLDYFQGMFMHSWTESKMLSKVTLPINYGILLPVINFLYTDSCPEIENSDSIDFICNLLIVADQLFITRLREMCEIALANLINLKNCAELCQFGHTYNATQLKQCCMEFIALNLNSVLENRALDLLEETLLDDITQYYCKFNPIMSSRVITPFFNAPSDEIIEEFAKNYPVNLELTDEEYKKDDSIIEIVSKKKKGKKIEYTESEKERMRYESVSSVTSLDLSNDTSKDITLSLSKISKDTEKGTKDKQEKWTEVPSSQQKQLKVVQARLKAINIAKDIMNEAPSESFTKLTKSSSSSAMTIEKLPTSSRMSVSPKESPTSESIWGTQGNLVISHVGPKLSQKQRKKLAMQGTETSSQTIDDFFSKVTVGSPPEKPKNPWKICEPPVASSSPKSKTIEFNKILTDQKKQKEDHSRIMTKPLLMTQLEDKAIEQLERFYNIHEIDDELITVRRIELQVSSPQWLHTAPK
ncbi:hypothetical protein HW555_000248 [Spodoptera exigua]|uniref:BTB domain-containing protein n=1 Tax=Spodoptera exigua TaxID=7107 RepID=A0A835GVR4_SPOEX|nr:hypothetical protein HW555_000248 [Spodoptera exigua]